MLFIYNPKVTQVKNVLVKLFILTDGHRFVMNTSLSKSAVTPAKMVRSEVLFIYRCNTTTEMCCT